MTLRVMTYNILDGGKGREQDIVNVLLSVQPDVVILQEVYHPSLLEFLAKTLNADFFFGEANSSRHVGLLSRLPITSKRSLRPLPFIWRNVVEAEIEYAPQKKLGIIGVHPMANLAVVFEWWRLAEAKYITGLATKYSEPCLIAGDFNAIAPGDNVNVETMPRWLQTFIKLQGNRVYHFSIREYLSAGYTDCFRTLHSNDPGFTLPPPKPNSRLDYILANTALKPHLHKCWVVREPTDVLKASDHYPVVAEFEL
jgi:exodeoxyribonuclease III